MTDYPEAEIDARLVEFRRRYNIYLDHAIRRYTTSVWGGLAKEIAEADRLRGPGRGRGHAGIVVVETTRRPGEDIFRLVSERPREPDPLPGPALWPEDLP